MGLHYVSVPPSFGDQVARAAVATAVAATCAKEAPHGSGFGILGLNS